jgi:hypothetical protein
MSVRTVTMGPNVDNGYAIFLEHPQDGSPVVNVMTKMYVQRILQTGNVMLAEQLKDKGIKPYDPNEKRTLEQIVKFTHDCFIKMGYKDRTPRVVEGVDILYDFDDKKFQQTSNVQDCIKEIRKHYNLHGGGAFLFPAYPDLVPSGLLPPPPLPFIPMPSSPI